MRCHYWIFNTRNILEKIESFARGPYYHLLSGMWLFCGQKWWPRPKLFPRLDIFSTFVDHIILIYRRKSFIPDDRIKWTWPNINDSTRSLSPGIENVSIRPVFSKQPNNFPQQPIMTQNPPCNTLATVQTSNNWLQPNHQEDSRHTRKLSYLS